MGSDAGADTWVTLAIASHLINGTQSYPIEGMPVYIYEDRQMTLILEKDTSVDFAHRLLLRPFKRSYTVSVRDNKPLATLPTIMNKHL